MAIYNEILVGRINRGLQKLFGIKGTPPVRQLAGEIQPSYPLGSGEEDRWLQGWNTFWAAAAGIVGAAGNSPFFRMTNDVGSNVIAVIEKLVVGTLTADKIDVTFANQQPLVSGHVPNLTVLPSFAMDGRILTSGGSGQGNIICSTSTLTNNAGQLVMKRQTPAAQDLDLILFDDQEIIMVPQSLLSIFAEAAAQTMFVSVQWRERYLEDSERA
jgi:hypothetical protein